MARLEVAVVEARNLLQQNKSRENNSFARIHLGNQKRKTKTIEKSNDPEWKEIFILYVRFSLNSLIL
jgi:Ca2+-dependent lipid-binding protein